MKAALSWTADPSKIPATNRRILTLQTIEARLSIECLSELIRVTFFKSHETVFSNADPLNSFRRPILCPKHKRASCLLLYAG